MLQARSLYFLASLFAGLAVACSSNNNGRPATVAATVMRAAPVASSAAAAPTAPPTAALTASASPSPSPVAAVSGDLTVFAAASLTDAFNAIGANFQKANPNLKLTFNYAASTALRTQLQQGARADVFASADQATMDGARADGTIDGLDQLFVKNKLVVIYPTSNPAKISTIQDLAKPGLKFVLTDKSVPIGNYARQALAKMAADPAYGTGFDQKVLANLKSEEANVRAAVGKVQLGEADAAITYATDVNPSVARDVQSILIPDQFNVVATYPAAVVKGALNKAAAQTFLAYLRSPAGQDVFKKNNFIVDKDTGGAARLPVMTPPPRTFAWRGDVPPRSPTGEVAGSTWAVQHRVADLSQRGAVAMSRC